jgi:hypothetical protein
MHTPRFIAALSASAMAHRHHLLLGALLAAVACGGRSTDDLIASAGGAASGAGGQGGGVGGAGPGGAAGSGAWFAGGSGGTGGFPSAGGAPSFGGSAGIGGVAGVAGAGAGWGAGGQGGANWTACGPADSCVLEPVSCCGPGCEPVPLSAFTAINSKSVLDYTNSHPICPCIYAPCQVVLPEQRNVPNYIATCDQGQCKAIDIRTSALTACTSDADCYLRSGTSCCAGCGTDNLVAFSNKANVQTTLCAGGPFSCPAIACATPPPAGVSPFCNVSGHCVVNYARVGADGGRATPAPGNEGDDCATVPCASPLACCPATNTCTPNDSRICPSSVIVTCTKSSDCPAGQTCWVMGASTTGSGPSGSSCAAAAPPGAEGIACNYGPFGAMIADCPLPSSQWSSCWPAPHTPASLGVCIK